MRAAKIYLAKGILNAAWEFSLFMTAAEFPTAQRPSWQGKREKRGTDTASEGRARGGGRYASVISLKSL